MTEKTCANCNYIRFNDWNCTLHDKEVVNDYDICDKWEEIDE